MKLIKKYVEIEIKNKENGKMEKRRYTNFYLVNEMGNSIQVKPSFPTDFKTMLFLAEADSNE